MSAHAQVRGHEVIWNGESWVYMDTGMPVESQDRPCAHCGAKMVMLPVCTDEDGGMRKYELAQIDTCIAPIVQALQLARIDMLGSCCGHGSGIAHIPLKDGREVLIIDPDLVIFASYALDRNISEALSGCAKMQ